MKQLHKFLMGAPGNAEPAGTRYDPFKIGSELGVDVTGKILTRGTDTGSAHSTALCLNPKNTGKVYWECTVISSSQVKRLNGIVHGMAVYNFSVDSFIFPSGTVGWRGPDRIFVPIFPIISGGLYYNNLATTDPQFDYNIGETMMFAVDFDARKMWCGLSGLWFGANPATGTGEIFGFDGMGAGPWCIASSYTDAKQTQILTSKSEWLHAAPTGFKAWTAT